MWDYRNYINPSVSFCRLQWSSKYWAFNTSTESFCLVDQVSTAKCILLMFSNRGRGGIRMFGSRNLAKRINVASVTMLTVLLPTKMKIIMRRLKFNCRLLLRLYNWFVVNPFWKVRWCQYQNVSCILRIIFNFMLINRIKISYSMAEHLAQSRESWCSYTKILPYDFI